MDRCPKDEPTAKNLVCKKPLPIQEKNWKNLLGVAFIPSSLCHRTVKTAWQMNSNYCRTKLYYNIRKKKCLDINILRLQRVCMDASRMHYSSTHQYAGQQIFHFIRLVRLIKNYAGQQILRCYTDLRYHGFVVL